MNLKDFLNYFGIAFLGFLMFVSGFYFGYKYLEGQNGEKFVAGVSDIQESAQAIEKVEIVTKELDGVIWIKAGEEPICPQDHPIKGKYDGTTGFYYTKSNDFYDRVKAVVCFATEDYAQNSAGFIKKY